MSDQDTASLTTQGRVAAAFLKAGPLPSPYEMRDTLQDDMEELDIILGLGADPAEIVGALAFVLCSLYGYATVNDIDLDRALRVLIA